MEGSYLGPSASQASTSRGFEVEPGKIFPCDLCGNSFAKRKSLMIHALAHAEESEASQPKTSPDPQSHKLVKEQQIFTCSTCGKSFNRKERLNEHAKCHKDKKDVVYPCDQCPMRYEKKAWLERHKERKHAPKPPDAPPSPELECQLVHTCKVCNLEFHSEKALFQHERDHTGARPYACQVCQRSYRTYLDLKRHAKRHTEEEVRRVHTDPVFVCVSCDGKFPSEELLKEHERTHMVRRAFPCDICGKSFNSSSNLYNHKKTHTGVKSFVCDVCGYAFLSSGNLRRHLKIHKDLG